MRRWSAWTTRRSSVASRRRSPTSCSSASAAPSRRNGFSATIAPSANLNPERRFPSLFEPVHGSAPDIAGQQIANPVAMIWSAAMMLDFLGHNAGAERDAHDAIVAAIAGVLKEGPHTRDMGGSASTGEIGEAIAKRVAGNAG